MLTEQNPDQAIADGAPGGINGVSVCQNGKAKAIPGRQDLQKIQKSRRMNGSPP
jgi:hypothetical protein